MFEGSVWILCLFLYLCCLGEEEYVKRVFMVFQIGAIWIPSVKIHVSPPSSVYYC